MKCALASMGFINEDVQHNKNVIIETMIKYAKDARRDTFIPFLDGAAEPDTIEPVIVQEEESNLEIKDADSDVLFVTEEEPLTYEE